MRNFLFLLLAASVLLLSCSSDKVTSPDSGTETPEFAPALRGTVLVADKIFNKRSVVVTVSDGTLTLSTQPDSLGVYRFAELPEGTYTLTAALPDNNRCRFTPALQYVTVDGEPCLADDIIAYRPNMNRPVMICRFTTTSDVPIYGLMCSLDGEGIYKKKSINRDGLTMFEDVKIGRSYVLRTVPDYGNYTVSPERIDITVVDSLTVAEFHVVNEDKETYTASGRVVDADGVGVEGVVIDLKYKGIDVALTVTDSEGCYSIANIRNGAYTLSFWKPELNLPYRTYFTVSGADVVMPDIMGENPLTLYVLNGRILDMDGNGIPGVNVSLNCPSYHVMTCLDDTLTTDDGSYLFEVKMGSYLYSTFETLVVVPSREGYSFTPESHECTLVWLINEPDGGAFKLLEFGVTPGTEWSGSPRQHWYSYHGEYLGFETVTVSAGEFDLCQHYVSYINYGPDSRETWDIWLAHGTGIVKVSKVLETSQGTETLDYQLRTAVVPDNLR